MAKNKSNFTKSLVLLIVTALFSVLATVVDRAAIGYNDTVVGFSTLNGAFHNQFGYNEIFDTISDVAMGLAFLVVISFAIMGVMQLIRERKFSKVDKAILGLGVLYVVIAVIYVAFGKIPINYRPILQPGETELETSFPSTHTLIIVTVLGSAILAWNKLLKNKSLVKILKCLALVVIVVGTAARLFAGVHWATDIVAGILFSLTLISLYAACSLD